MSNKKQSVQVTAAIIAGLILLFVTLRVFITYQANKLAENAISPHGLQLEKLTWRFRSFSEVYIDEIYIIQPTPKSRNSLLIKDVSIRFSLAKLLLSDAGYSEKFPNIDAELVRARVEDLDALYSLEETLSAPGNEQSDRATPLGRLNVNSGKIELPALSSELRFNLEKLTNSKVLAANFQLLAKESSAFGVGEIHFNLDNQTLNGSLEVTFEDLAPLITAIPARMSESFKASFFKVNPALKGGTWKSNWHGSISEWQSTHELIDAQLQINNILVEQSDSPVDIKLSGRFEFNGNDKKTSLRLSKFDSVVIDSLDSNSINDLLAFQTTDTSSLQPQLSNTVDVDLPEEVILSDSSVSFKQPLLVRDKWNELSISKLAYDFSKGSGNAQLHINSKVFFLQQKAPSLLDVKISSFLEKKENSFCAKGAEVIVSTNKHFNFLVDKHALSISNGALTSKAYGCFTDGQLDFNTPFALSLPQASIDELIFPGIEINGELEWENDMFSLLASPVIAGELFAAKAEGTLKQIDFSLASEQTQLNQFNEFIKQISPTATVNTGDADFEITGTFEEGKLTAHAITRLKDIAMTIDDISLAGVHSFLDVELANDSTLNTNKADFSFELVDVGIPVENISGTLKIEGQTSAPNIVISDTQGTLLGGTFNISPVYLPNPNKSLSIVHLNSLELSELIALTGNQDISITGKISGSVPVSFSEGYVKVSDAQLESIEPGVLKLRHSQSIEAIKNQESSFSTALTLLENLHYSVLSGEGTMDENGQINLKINVQGNNPEQEQAVDFNLNYEDNIFTRLKVLRINQSLTDSIQKKLEN